MYIFGNNGLPDNLGFHRLQINNFSRFFDRKQNKKAVLSPKKCHCEKI